MQTQFLVNPHLPGDSFFWEGNSTGVLLFHGFTATAAEVYPLAQELHALGYTVSGPLLPGHGTSPSDLNQTKWTDWIETAEKAYQELAARCDKIIVGGESNGGMVSLYLASQHPEIAMLLLFSPAMKLDLTLLDQFKLRLGAPFMEWLDKGDAFGNNKWQGYTVNPLKAVLQMEKLQNQVKKQLPRIKHPVQIIQGRHDKTIDVASAEIVLSSLGSEDKQLHWLEDSGHVVLLEDEMDRIMQHTRAFLRKHDLLSTEELAPV